MQPGAHLVGANRTATITALLDWCRGLIHFTGDFRAGNVESQWQYRGGYPPVSRIITGTPFTGEENMPLGGILHRTAGCHGTAGFLRAVLRTVNIPVQERYANGHGIVAFTSESRYLSHADDPYSRLTRSIRPSPRRSS